MPNTPMVKASMVQGIRRPIQPSTISLTSCTPKVFGEIAGEKNSVIFDNALMDQMHQAAHRRQRADDRDAEHNVETWVTVWKAASRRFEVAK